MNTFSLSAWILQSITLFLAILAAVPLIRALVGLSIVAFSETFGLQNSALRKIGIKIVPAFLRASLGFGLVMGVATPASAEPVQTQIPVIDRVIDFDSTTNQTSENSPDEVETEAETEAEAETDAEAEAEAVPVAQKEVIKTEQTSKNIYKIRAGDSLWTIAQNEVVGEGASVDEIDSAWREIWRMNKDVIGDNPSLIRPGQEIRLDVVSK